MWQSRRILKALEHYLTWRLRECGSPVPITQGAFYQFPDFGCFGEALRFRDITTSEIFCKRLLEETGIAVLPGSVFGRPPEEFTVRISYVDFDGARALAAAELWPGNRELNDDFLKEYCGSVLLAVDLLHQWLHQ